MRTYLKAVQDFVSEVGVAGGTGPISLAVGNEADGVRRVIQYIREAHQYVCELWPDWEFLWQQEEASTTAGMVGSTLLPLPDPEPREYMLVDNAFQIKVGTAWRRVRYIPWEQYRNQYRVGTPKAQSLTPTHWTVRPDRRVELSHPIGGVFDYRYEYYRKFPDLVNDDDEIIIPIDRIVIVRAKIIFAERENAPEHMQGASSEYDDIMQRLEANYLTDAEGGRHGAQRDIVVRDV